MKDKDTDRVEENEHEEWYKILKGNINEAFFLGQMVFDKQGNPVDYIVLDINELLEEIMGWSRDSILGERATEVFNDSSGIRQYGEVARTGVPNQRREYDEMQGKWYECRAHSLFRENKFFVIYSDITAQMNAEEARERSNKEYYRKTNKLMEDKLILQESVNKYKVLFEGIDEGYCIVEMIFDAAGNPVDYLFVEENAVFEKQTGLHDVSGKLMRSLVPEHEEYWFELYGRVALTGESIRFMNEAKALNRWFSVFAFKVGEGDSRKVAVLFNDITVEIKNQRKIEEFLKMQEEFFTNISHELKTPLNVIFSTNQLLEMYLKNNLITDSGGRIHKTITMVKQNCFRMTKLINNVVDLSKIGNGFLKFTPSNEDIVHIIKDIVHSVSDYVQRKEISISFAADVEQKILACDPEKMERILLNLISNSIKFTNPKGYIFVNFFDKGDAVEITVKDTGIGIDHEHLDKIFERFQQVDKTLFRNAEGTGIGLSLVKSFVDMHGGIICVESEVGKGALFKIEIPVRRVEQEAEHKKTQPMRSRVEMINIEFSDIYAL